MPRFQLERARQARPRGDNQAGFTLIELMVVVAIIVLAAGLMTPTITDFFKNRQLESIKGTFGSAFTTARMMAVNAGSRYSLVFFREGPRIYNEKAKTFETDDLFNPETSPLADDKTWYVLGFFEHKPSTELMRYRAWEKTQKAVSVTEEEGKPAKKAGALPVYDVAGLAKLTYERDGTLTFSVGADVGTAAWKAEPEPRDGDIIVYQHESSSACFIDLRGTGQLKPRITAIRDPKRRPAEETTGGGSTAEPDATSESAEADEGAGGGEG